MNLEAAIQFTRSARLSLVYRRKAKTRSTEGAGYTPWLGRARLGVRPCAPIGATTVRGLANSTPVPLLDSSSTYGQSPPPEIPLFSGPRRTPPARPDAADFPPAPDRWKEYSAPRPPRESPWHNRQTRIPCWRRLTRCRRTRATPPSPPLPASAPPSCEPAPASRGSRSRSAPPRAAPPERPGGTPRPTSVPSPASARASPPARSPL